MFKKFANAAQSLKEKADVGSKLEATKQFAASKYEASKMEANVIFEKHWPTVEHIIVDGLLSITEEKLSDDKTLESIFDKLYEALPLVARLAFSRDQFIEFTMAQRTPLLVKVQDVRVQRQATLASTQKPLELPNISEV